MKTIIQRVRGRTEIKTTWEGRTESHSFQGAGLVVLLGWTDSDANLSPEELAKNEDWLISRAQGLRVFPDKDDKMNLSLADYMRDAALPESGILWVPQFTLAASLDSGFRPSFTAALAPASARGRFELLKKRLAEQATPYKNYFGRFGADMELSFTNWGPVTVPLERS